MNKRQRKKQRTRYNKEEMKAYLAFSAEFASRWDIEYRIITHPRRSWLTKAAWKARKEKFSADLVAEKAWVQKKLETHNYTLAGWLPK